MAKESKQKPVKKGVRVEWGMQIGKRFHLDSAKHVGTMEEALILADQKRGMGFTEVRCKNCEE